MKQIVVKLLSVIFIFWRFFTMKDKVIKVLKVEPKKKPEICLLENELQALQEAVSIGAEYTGLIEIINLDRGVCLLCNEEGKIIGLEPNRRLGNDIICGVFYIIGEDETGELVSLSEEDTEFYTNYFIKIFEIVSIEFSIFF